MKTEDGDPMIRTVGVLPQEYIHGGSWGAIIPDGRYSHMSGSIPLPFHKCTQSKVAFVLQTPEHRSQKVLQGVA